MSLFIMDVLRLYDMAIYFHNIAINHQMSTLPVINPYCQWKLHDAINITSPEAFTSGHVVCNGIVYR